MASTDKDYRQEGDQPRRRGTSSIYDSEREDVVKEFAESNYDMWLQWIEESMGSEMTWDTELREFIEDYTNINLIGVFGQTDGVRILEFGKLGVGEGMIVNTKDAPGEHWVAFYCFPSENIMMYDSFGRSYRELFDEEDRTIDNTEEDAEQELIEDNCGQRCIAWLLVAEYGEHYAKWI